MTVFLRIVNLCSENIIHRMQFHVLANQGFEVLAHNKQTTGEVLAPAYTGYLVARQTLKDVIMIIIVYGSI
jgi:hypothetical protein